LFRDILSRILYLGPLREYPQRIYFWAGEAPSDVGLRGELAVPALLAGSRSQEKTALVEKIEYWLKQMGMAYSFKIEQIRGRTEYEIRIKRTERSAEVLITDVGFGVSQILPVLVLCYYVPEGSILILEQPEIHLHPSVQSVLGDVLIDVVKNRGLQIIFESHSEHLLRRLQRRIAEESVTNDETALYFCDMKDGASQIEALQVDEFGNISNWPKDFFGDDTGDLVAMTQAAFRRQELP
jgi:predicted ATPase